MVSCRHCQAHNLGCRMSSLSKKCGNCLASGVNVCEPGDLPPLDFSKIDRALKKLEAQESAAEAAEEAAAAQVEAALAQAQAARAKLRRLRKSKRLLKEKEQKMFSEGLSAVEDLEQLEALEHLGQEIASVNPDAPPLAEVVDWSVFWSPGSAGETVEAVAGTSGGS